MINREQIRKIATNVGTFRKGDAYFLSGLVGDIITARNNKEEIISARVKGSKTYKPIIYLSQQGSKVNRYACTCPAYSSYPGACKHIVATLLAYTEGGVMKKLEPMQITIDNPPAPKMNKGLSDLIESYKKITYPEPLLEGSVRLIPQISIKYDQVPRISFKIGKEKYYVVKDVKGFIEAIKYHKIVEYGKNLTLKHEINQFAKEDHALIDLVYHQLEYGGKVRGLSSYLEDKKHLAFGLWEFDRFFDLYEGQALERGDEAKQKIGLIKGDPPIRFRMDQAAQQFLMRLSDQEPCIILQDENYVLYKENLYQISQSFKEKSIPLIRAVQQNRDKILAIDEEVMPTVCQVILPQIKKQLQVNMDEEQLTRYIPPKCKPSFYLDVAGNEKLALKVTYQYGEHTINPLSPIKPTVSFLREEYTEKQIQQQIKAYGFGETKEDYFELKGEEAIYNLLVEGMEWLKVYGEVYISESLKNIKVREVRQASVGVKLRQNLIELDLESLGISHKELAKLLKAYRLKKKYYRLKEGEFINLEGEGIEGLNEVVEHLGLTDKALSQKVIQIEAYRALYLNEVLEKKKGIKLQRDSSFKTLIRAFEEVEESEIPVPESLESVLRSYQVLGYRWMKLLGQHGLGGILADDMGLGKSLQVITLLEAERSDRPSLIVCPTSLVLNWVKEFQKFSPLARVLTLTGNVSERENKFKMLHEYEVIITSYDLLKRDIEQYTSWQFNYCIIDEAQYIKNSTTQNAKAVKQVQSQKRMALTGTPIENSLSELWSIFDFIMPGYLFTDSYFRKQIENPIVKEQNQQAAHRLKQMIAPFILRRLKQNVLEELPEKIESVVYSELSREQQKVYTAYALEAKKELLEQIEEEGIEKSHIKMLACLTRLRQICCHPSLFLENYEGESSKLSTCLELVKNAVGAGHKILLFSQFTTMLEVISQAFEKEGISYSLLKGDVKAEKRMEMVETFNEGDTSVFLISLKAGGVGLNLTSADVVIHYDPWWNLSAQNQATDRAYRMGQMNHVQVFQLITKGTIEEKIKALQDEKQNLTENILSTEQMLLSQFSKEELMDLMSYTL